MIELTIEERQALAGIRSRLTNPDGTPVFADDRAAPSSLCSCVDCRCESLRTISFPVVCLQCRLGAHATARS